MDKVCKVISGREFDSSLYKQIMDIRREHYYPSAFNIQYWLGGIHGLLSEESIKDSHLVDPSSRFIFIMEEDCLLGYARYSINCEIQKNIAISRLHIFACKKNILGKKIKVSKGTEISEIKVGQFLLDSVIEDCSKAKSSILVSEISVFPYPNLPSLKLHYRKGFLSISKSLKKVERDDATVDFIVLGKVLADPIETIELLSSISI